MIYIIPQIAKDAGIRTANLMNLLVQIPELPTEFTNFEFRHKFELDGSSTTRYLKSLVDKKLIDVKRIHGITRWFMLTPRGLNIISECVSTPGNIFSEFETTKQKKAADNG